MIRSPRFIHRSIVQYCQHQDGTPLGLAIQNTSSSNHFSRLNKILAQTFPKVSVANEIDVREPMLLNHVSLHAVYLHVMATQCSEANYPVNHL